MVAAKENEKVLGVVSTLGSSW
uniref:Uncharacterized protein n=1 Tax=Anguilla anguilla TaxID=7936 RepID=A0A0E9P594_ANGAN